MGNRTLLQNPEITLKVSGEMTTRSVQDLLTALMGYSYNKPERTFDGVLTLQLRETTPPVQEELPEA